MPYPLDEDLLHADADKAVAGIVRVWEPPSVTVVLGRSNVPETEVYLSRCAFDGVPVIRRMGGGGAVVLAPGCLVLSLVKAVEHPTAVRIHLEQTVRLIQKGLEAIGAPATNRKGTGDLCIGNRKIFGSSVFQRRNLFFFQGSLLVGMDLASVDRYLCHPSREPPYRRGRTHRQFLSTLSEQGVIMPTAEIQQSLFRAMSEGLSRIS